MATAAKISNDRRYEIGGLILICLSVLLFVSLVSDQYDGLPRRPFDGLANGETNGLGAPGALIAGFLCMLAGQASHVLYVIPAIWGVMLFRHRPLDRLPARLIGLMVLLASGALLLHVDVPAAHDYERVGGTLGAFMTRYIHSYVGIIGSHVIGVTLALIGLLLSTDILFLRVFDRLRALAALLGRTWLGLWHGLQARAKRKQREREARRPGKAPKTVDARVVRESEMELEAELSTLAPAGAVDRIRIWGATGPDLAEEESPFAQPPVVAAPTASPQSIATQAERAMAEPAPASDTLEPASEPAAFEPEAFEEGDSPEPAALPVETAPAAKDKKPRRPVMPRRKTVEEYELPPDYEYPKRYTRPPLDIFDPPEPSPAVNTSQHLIETSALLEETLKTFGIEARVTDVTRGPTITRFELEPAPGIKVSRFMSLADDLALALKAHRVRVEAPIPGKGRVGIEIPNRDRDPVVLRELLEAKEFRKGKGVLNLTLGKDIAGETLVADMTAMPHLLVAGATGSGKTVCVKTLLASLLCARTPDELQLMLIDPKMVELSIFNDIPHLITPVVIDPKKAASALNWLIVEMEERYRLFAHLRVRNIDVYNQSVDNGEIEMPGDEGNSVDVIRKLPYIVCIIDELADLMMLARAEVEDAIGRLAQLARAVGIHLIIATQRPSVDVLTGVIKANFPARISFQVSSRVDSRCILDEIGAERLIGRGDMLFLPPGRSKPHRIQGAFVSDEEMNRLIAYLKTQAPPQYRDEIEKFGKSNEALENLEDQDDELFDEAVRVVLDTGQASISMVQRKLRVGYTRAARLIDMMEAKGIVGPHVGSKAREILVDRPPENDET